MIKLLLAQAIESCSLRDMHEGMEKNLHEFLQPYVAYWSACSRWRNFNNVVEQKKNASIIKYVQSYHH